MSLLPGPSLTKRFRATLTIPFLSMALAACSGGLDTGSIFEGTSNAPQQPVLSTKTAARVALLVPLSGRGKLGEIGRALKEAGELAIFDAGGNEIILVPKDTRGTPEGARIAAREAVAEGAEIILGPLLSTSVGPVAQEARARNIPVLAFSTNVKVAGKGVYLLSFLPSQEIKRVVDYASAKGSEGFGALIPQSPYGNLVNAALNNAVTARGGKVISIEQYAQNVTSAEKNIKRIAAFATSSRSGIDAILLPQGGSLLHDMAELLQQNGIENNNVRLLGTGLWDEPGLSAISALHGGWYASPDPSAKAAFIARYKNAYDKTPLRIASLAYDGVSLAAVLAGGEPGTRYSAENLTNPDGFDGADGLFRLLPNGTNDRALAVLEIQPGGARVVSPAPRRFANSPSG